ncbi:hypothetical protein [Haloferax sp. Atlit-4N]|uniref:hypothetical protein n=1 Tax=Haloferax sp. Atlit-4N TaxID=2077206 RepID=UPI0011C07AEF|nr:hypothetical protein [Haloferax sp. Atlit-4N]
MVLQISNCVFSNCSSAIKSDVPVHIENTVVQGHSDTGLKVRGHDSPVSVSGENLYFASKDGRLGFDFENVNANIYNSTIRDHYEDDIRLGPNVLADFGSVKTGKVQDTARLDRPVIPTTEPVERDFSINTTTGRLQREHQLAKAKVVSSALSKLIRGGF